MKNSALAEPSLRVSGRASAWHALLALCCAAVANAAAPPAPASLQAMRHYQLLEGARARYEVLAAEPDLTRLPALPRRSLAAGDEYAGVAALRTLLIAVGDLPATPATIEPPMATGTPATVLDAPLVAALVRFQERHGLQQDGVLGPATWRALTTPLATRLHQIDSTLARWRSLPANPHQRAIFINIPRFRLYAMNALDDSEADLLQMDVIVGRVIEKLRTPTFTADLTHLIFRPYWEVPRSITLAELLPAARRDPGYFSSRHYELVDGAGSVVPYSPAQLDRLASGALRVRQRPGDDNALGAVKFMLPNPHGVYLHDTPEHALFARNMRAFSHGCIRVADPARLAAWLLDHDPAWSAEQITAAMHGTTSLRVDLPEPVRVYIVYGTAVAREDGSVLFLDDLYALDRD
jgi:murein L,D-transpeptidase YcbB/YkuD